MSLRYIFKVEEKKNKSKMCCSTLHSRVVMGKLKRSIFKKVTTNRRFSDHYVKRNTDTEITKSDYQELKKYKIHIVLDNIRSALNVGSIFRTADACRVAEVVTTGYTPTPPHKKIKKTALGAEDYVDTRHFDSTKEALEQLKREGLTILALETTSNAESHTEYQYPSSGVALVLGNEVSGIDTSIMDEYCDDTIEIKCHGYKNSLNVANVCGIVSFEILRQWTVQENS